jgi:DNA topoisomerase-1
MDKPVFMGYSDPKHPEADRYQKVLSEIRDSGKYYPPVVVQEDDHYIIMDGTHRVEALKNLGVKNISVWILGKSLTNKKSFVESEHPRAGEGQANGGQFVSGSGGQGSSSSDNESKPSATSTSHSDSDTGTRTPSGLLIPRAWTSVKLAKTPNEPLQATGIDVKGRTQYLYSAAHCEKAAAEKFSRIRAFRDALPKISDQINKDRETDESAAALYLIQKTGFRVGSNKDTLAKTKAYGASTLLGKHVQIKDDMVSFDFIGKKGVHIQRQVKDADLAADLAPRITHPDEPIFNTSDVAIRSYLGKISGEPFTPKDFRTWTGTETALKEVMSDGTPSDEKDFNKRVHGVAVTVSKILGNTPDMALKAYIDPSVFSRWRSSMSTKAEEQVVQISLQEFLDLVQYDETGDWKQTPETNEDPDDNE